MQLVIAEKPSVARDLARVLGVRTGGGGKTAFEGERCVITWCIGHLVELDEPASYDTRWKAWRLDTLPMLPDELKLRPAKHAREQLRAVTALLKDRRFTHVVNACDAGREGELIFRYVYQYAKARLPVQRLWVSSLTDEAIRRGFAALRPGRQLDPLGDAARCRSEADWLVGMNATRAVTVRGRTGPSAGGERGVLYSIGRVQTPTLAMLVAREREIRAFVPRPYWEVRGELRTEDGARFTALWRAASGPSLSGPPLPGGPSLSGPPLPGGPSLSGPPLPDDKPEGRAGRLASAELAAALVERDTAHGRPEHVHGPRVERVREKTVREPPPLLFDLTSLQRTANRRFGFSAARTLELAQALYERHKVLTYPRTDSRHLSTDAVAGLPALFEALAGVPAYAPFASALLAEPPRPSRRVVDDSKVTDHHAIVPTGTAIRLEALDRDEQRIFDLVARRFLGVFFPDAELAVTEVWIRVGPSEPAAAPAGKEPEVRDGEPPILSALPAMPDRYFARGRVRVRAGWQEVAGIGPEREKRDDDRRDDERDAEPLGALPRLVEGQPLAGSFAPVARQTTPPPRYSEATLLGAMESAGKAMDDEAMRAAMRDRGLGTPATRAAIIETLLRRAYIERAQKHLVPTEMGMALIAALPVASLASPELTGTWEARLAQIARGEDTRERFMDDIARYVRELVEAICVAPAPALPPGTAPDQPPAWGKGKRGSKWGSGSARGKRGGRRERGRADGERAPRAAPPRTPRAAAPRAAAPRAATPRAAAPPAELGCPRCRQGTLITGSRGWGCSRWREGCRFVVWFQTAGRRLTAAQLRDLVTRGKTRRSEFQPDGAGARSGRLVLDVGLDGGAARFEPE